MLYGFNIKTQIVSNELGHAYWKTWDNTSPLYSTACQLFILLVFFITELLLSCVSPLELWSALKTVLNHQPDAVIPVKGAGLGTKD